MALNVVSRRPNTSVAFGGITDITGSADGFSSVASDPKATWNPTG
jgi:hypothetical protein